MSRRDEPIGQQAFVAKLLRAGVSLEFAPAAVIVWAGFGDWGTNVGTWTPTRWAAALERERPPDSLARLRTVRLLV